MEAYQSLADLRPYTSELLYHRSRYWYYTSCFVCDLLQDVSLRDRFDPADLSRVNRCLLTQLLAQPLAESELLILSWILHFPDQDCPLAINPVNDQPVPVFATKKQNSTWDGRQHLLALCAHFCIQVHESPDKIGISRADFIKLADNRCPRVRSNLFTAVNLLKKQGVGVCFLH